MHIMKLGDALRALAEQLSTDPAQPASLHDVAAAIGDGTTAEVRCAKRWVTPPASASHSPERACECLPLTWPSINLL